MAVSGAVQTNSVLLKLGQPLLARCAGEEEGDFVGRDLGELEPLLSPLRDDGPLREDQGAVDALACVHAAAEDLNGGVGLPQPHPKKQPYPR